MAYQKKLSSRAGHVEILLLVIVRAQKDMAGTLPPPDGGWLGSSVSLAPLPPKQGRAVLPVTISGWHKFWGGGLDTWFCYLSAALPPTLPNRATIFRPLLKTAPRRLLAVAPADAIELHTKFQTNALSD
ncbi:hypothetical protein B0T26DRAFT_132740 [Lasiosphaeria miniovina]|uniref:Uncharacterized protein n=1 Tax=Lasiosphaeria miniovina TaxID=1954250 RepID=A0AA40B4J2_9PEZI|nr:uncharacterized protein B0T26DRAFT_132740 [Lasiosphaeria miniovina]KAK0727382.1 hypothetical protein B0T26DRAFT_132740 [Lasiosphaeria miniovina]